MSEVAIKRFVGTPSVRSAVAAAEIDRTDRAIFDDPWFDEFRHMMPRDRLRERLAALYDAAYLAGFADGRVHALDHGGLL